MSTLLTTLVVAVEGGEGIPADHVAAKLAVPLGILFFCGSVFALLWSNYGARKGALIYGTALGGFCMVLGVFWWFGAPGTPVATGLQNFPGQPADAYQSAWFAFEPGSETAQFFPASNDLGEFVTIQDYLGLADVPADELGSDPQYANLNGDVAQAEALMVELALRQGESGETRLGGQARAEYQEAGEQGLVAEVGPQAAQDFVRADPFFTATPGDERLVTESNGTFLAGSEVTLATNYQGPDGEIVPIEVDTVTMFAFKQPSALWFPSAAWTGLSFLLFALCLFGLDRIEQREKRRAQEVTEPEDLAVPIRQ